jgi:hypothetical protein
VELEGARLSVEAPWLGIVGFPRSLERSARLAAGWMSGPGGRFDLDDVPYIPGVALSIEATGHRELDWPLPSSDTFDVALELTPLVSSDAPRSTDGTTLFGTVETAAVDASGAGLNGWVVQVLDPTSLDPNLIPNVTLEARGESSSVATRTAEDGTFELGRLLERAYDLRAYDPERFTSIVAERVPAGTEGLELCLAEDALVAALHVTVRTRDGAPVAKAQLAVQFVLEQSSSGFMWDTGQSRLTTTRAPRRCPASRAPAPA